VEKGSLKKVLGVIYGKCIRRVKITSHFLANLHEIKDCQKKLMKE